MLEHLCWRPVLKQDPADFIVREVRRGGAFSGRHDSAHQYATLRKAGFTTMEAIEMVAAELAVPPSGISYSGLKDEDGITEQYIAAKDGFPWQGAKSIGDGKYSASRHLIVEPRDEWGEPLQIGDLLGNTFKVTVRGLASEQAEALSSRRVVDTAFFNYYDLQRFGLPGGPKNTHLVGDAVRAGDWALALERLVLTQTEPGRAAADTHLSPSEFFRSLDRRLLLFYCSSSASFEWNASLASAVQRSLADPQEVIEDGIPFLFCGPCENPYSLGARYPVLPMVRFTVSDVIAETSPSFRPSLIQVRFLCSNLAADDRRPGLHTCDLEFFLPSGTYATMAVSQLIRSHMKHIDYSKG